MNLRNRNSFLSCLPYSECLLPCHHTWRKPRTRKSIDEKIKDWSLDDILKLSKKSCFYTHDEIEEVRLICGRGSKFVILSKECESKFSPDEEQFKQLSQILSAIEPLRKKLWIAGKWNTLLDMGFMKSF